MYQINPSSAMTELYGINKGAAQVFDNKNVEAAILSKQKEGIADKKAKAAEEKSILVDIGKLGKGAIRPSDLGYFSDGQKNIYDKVKKYYTDAKGGELSVDQQVEIESDIVKLQTEANVSAQLSSKNTANAKLASANPGKFRKSSVDAVVANQFDKKFAGNFDDPGDLQGYVDLNQFVNEKLAPEAMRQAQMINNGDNYDNTAEDRKALVYGMFKSNPENLIQAQINYDEIPVDERLNTDNPLDYYTKLWDSKLTVKHTPRPFAAQMGGVGGSTATTPKITSQEQEDGTYNTSFVAKPVQMDAGQGIQKGTIKNIQNDANGKIISAVFQPEINEADKAIADQNFIEIRSAEINNAKQNAAFNDAVGEYKANMGGDKFDEISEKIKKKELTIDEVNADNVVRDKSGKKIKYPNRGEYPLMKVDKVNIPLPKAITITDPNELFDLHNQLGVTQNELGALNKGGKNVRNKQINYEHVGLKKTGAEKKYIIKGKSYAEVAVRKAAEASGMSVDQYIKEANK